MKMTRNRLVVQHMFRTSEVIRNLKNSRIELSKASSATRIVIEDGKVSHEFNKQINEILNQSSLLIKKLEGFDANVFDPIPFISSYDIKHKTIDLVKGTNYVGFLDLNTCKVNIISEDKTDAQLEQQSAK